MKNIKRLLLISILSITLSGCDSFNKIKNRKLITFIGEDKLLFGRYPQTKVTKKSLINRLNIKSGALPSPENSRKWTPFDWYYKSSNSEKFAWYIDIDLNSDGENDYRGVYFTSYRPYLTYVEKLYNEDIFQADNGFYSSNVYWFKYEKIQWKILSSDNDYFVMSNKIIDSSQFSSFYPTSEEQLDENRSDYEGNIDLAYPNNYQYSDLRTLLNVNFYNDAFKSKEKEIIKKTKIDIVNDTMLKDKYEAVNDYVFILSEDDINDSEDKLNWSDFDNGALRRVTDYAACMGCQINYNMEDSGLLCGNWWIRESGSSSYCSYDECLVMEGRSYWWNYGKEVFYTNIGVVPALFINK